ncbi:hypothetical protein QQ73_11100 [Candidatus Endoriftia persephone str. Guaymas]|nr:hypothetical protein [Candidatus Endoriftia persephone str. Guaymas]
MVKKAFEWIRARGFDLIITGEVIGQRPMSQRKDTMPVVAGESGAEDLLLRPLCAKNLPETLPEARIGIGAVTVHWVEQHLLILLHDVDDMQLDAQLLRHPERIVALRLALVALADRMGVALDAESGEEVDPLHMDPLGLDHLSGE